MTYVSKNVRVFLEAKDKIELTSVRSEGRLKNYSSAIDARAWCDFVEDRRQHILEYQSKGRTGLCPGSLVPVDKLVQILMSGKDKEVQQLQKKIEYYEELIKIYDSLLTPEQKAKLEELKKALDAKYAEGGEGDEVCKAPCATGTQTKGAETTDAECDAKCSCDDIEESVCAIHSCTGPCSDADIGSKAKESICSAPCATDSNRTYASAPDCPADKKGSSNECKCEQNRDSGTAYVCKGPCSLD